MCIAASEDSKTFVGMRVQNGEIKFKQPDQGSLIKEQQAFIIYRIEYKSLEFKATNPLIRYARKIKEVGCPYIPVSAQEEGDTFLVEHILSHRLVHENSDAFQLEFFIKWANYPYRECTWEPHKNLSCDELLAEYQEGLSVDEKDRLNLYLKPLN